MRVDGRMIDYNSHDYIELLEDLSRDCESAADDHYCATLVAASAQAPVPAVQATPTASESPPVRPPATATDDDLSECDSAQCAYLNYYRSYRSAADLQSTTLAPIRMTERQAD
jgi:hypothetical protein